MSTVVTTAVRYPHLNKRVIHENAQGEAIDDDATGRQRYVAALVQDSCRPARLGVVCVQRRLQGPRLLLLCVLKLRLLRQPVTGMANLTQPRQLPPTSCVLRSILLKLHKQRERVSKHVPA